jgi:hypothetical protein
MGHAVSQRQFRDKVVYHRLEWRLFVEMKTKNKDVEVIAITVGSVQTTLNKASPEPVPSHSGDIRSGAYGQGGMRKGRRS